MRAVLPTPAGPVGGSAHSLATWSVEAVATKRPSGENCAAVTMLPVPLSDTMDSRWSPVAASHTCARGGVKCGAEVCVGGGGNCEGGRSNAPCGGSWFIQLARKSAHAIPWLPKNFELHV
eukprot:364688-Chlamydomonas_euryale.AAC.3